jgi:hypothetical protein
MLAPLVEHCIYACFTDFLFFCQSTIEMRRKLIFTVKVPSERHIVEIRCKYAKDFRKKGIKFPVIKNYAIPTELREEINLYFIKHYAFM